MNMIASLSNNFIINPLSTNPKKPSNTLKQFVGSCWRIVWVCLTILWGGAGRVNFFCLYQQLHKYNAFNSAQPDNLLTIQTNKYIVIDKSRNKKELFYRKTGNIIKRVKEPVQIFDKLQSKHRNILICFVPNLLLP